MKHQIKQTFAFYVPCFVIQTLGGMITQQSVTTWYVTLNKSILTPPGFVFGIVWTILYAMMAVAAARIYALRGTLNSRSLIWWGIQLILGFLWTCTFFGQQQVTQALAIIVVNWLAVAVVVKRFWFADRIAGRLMLPLLLWLSFAVYLNAVVVLRN